MTTSKSPPSSPPSAVLIFFLALPWIVVPLSILCHTSELVTFILDKMLFPNFEIVLSAVASLVMLLLLVQRFDGTPVGVVLGVHYAIVVGLLLWIPMMILPARITKALGRIYETVEHMSLAILFHKEENPPFLVASFLLALDVWIIQSWIGRRLGDHHAEIVALTRQVATFLCGQAMAIAYSAVCFVHHGGSVRRFQTLWSGILNFGGATLFLFLMCILVKVGMACLDELLTSRCDHNTTSGVTNLYNETAVSTVDLCAFQNYFQ